MKHLQGSYSRAFNRRWQRTGPLWQSRYQARLVEDQRYFDQLMVYIHLNPVRAGLVSDPAEYVFSGHRELLGKVISPLVDVDEGLVGFGRTLRAARKYHGARHLYHLLDVASRGALLAHGQPARRSGYHQSGIARPVSAG